MRFGVIHFVFLFTTIFLMSYYSRTNTYLSWFFFTPGHDYETMVLLSKWLLLPTLAGVLAAALLKAHYERVM